MKFPKELLVTWEEPGGNEEEFFIVHETPAGAAAIGESVEVGIYQLVRRTRISVEVKVAG